MKPCSTDNNQNNTSSTILEGELKILANNKWKSRFGRLERCSSSGLLTISIYKNAKNSKKFQKRKECIELEHYLAIESGFVFLGEQHCLSVVCLSRVCTLAMQSYTQLVLWEQCIRSMLGYGVQYNVRVCQAPPASIVYKEDPNLRLHLYDGRFCLVVDKPPRIVSHWKLSQLRSYGHVVNKFIFEAGSRVGSQREGMFMLLSGQAENMDKAFKLAAANKLTKHNCRDTKWTTGADSHRPDERNRTSDSDRDRDNNKTTDRHSDTRPLLASIASSNDALFHPVDSYTNEVFDTTDEPPTPANKQTPVGLTTFPLLCDSPKSQTIIELPDIIVEDACDVLKKSNYYNQAFVDSIGFYYNTQGTLNKQRPIKSKSMPLGQENSEPIKPTEYTPMTYVAYDPSTPKPNRRTHGHSLHRSRHISAPDSGFDPMVAVSRRFNSSGHTSMAATSKALVWLTKLKHRAQRAASDPSGRKLDRSGTGTGTRAPPTSPMDLRWKPVNNDSLDLDVPVYSSKPDTQIQLGSEESDTEHISSQDEVKSCRMDIVDTEESTFEHARPALRKISKIRNHNEGLVKIDKEKECSSLQLVLTPQSRLRIAKQLNQPVFGRPKRVSLTGSSCSIPDGVAPSPPAYADATRFSCRTPGFAPDRTDRLSPHWCSSTRSSPGSGPPPSATSTAPSIFLFPPDAAKLNYCDVEVLPRSPTTPGPTPHVATNYAQIDVLATEAIAQMQSRRFKRFPSSECKRASSVQDLDSAGVGKTPRSKRGLRPSLTLDRKPSLNSINS